MTALGASSSFSPPTVGQPCDSPVPGEAECTTAKPRGTQSRTSERDIMPRRSRWETFGASLRFGGFLPSS